MRRCGFTLVEVNLAIGALAVGLVSIMALFSLSFKEGRESSEDLQSCAAADAIFSPIVMAASSTNLVWSKFREIDNYPDGANEGWKVYTRSALGSYYLPVYNSSDKASSAFSGIMKELIECSNGTLDLNTTMPDPTGGELRYALLVQHTVGSPILRLSFRAVKNATMLFSGPLYYTEVRFQGDPTK